MKKTLITLTAAGLMLANICSAQETTTTTTTDVRDKPKFGLKIGGNYSNVYDAQGEAFVADPKFGLAVGAFLTLPLGTYIGVQPEILYSQKGFKATGILLGDTYKFTRTTSYIDVPVFLALKPTSFITVLVGPQYSYLVKQRDVFANTTTSIAQEKEFAADNIRKNIFGLSLGADLNMDHLVISGRLGWDIMANNGDGTSTTPRYKNNWYQVTLGYRFYND